MCLSCDPANDNDEGCGCAGCLMIPAGIALTFIVGSLMVWAGTGMNRAGVHPLLAALIVIGVIAALVALFIYALIRYRRRYAPTSEQKSEAERQRREALMLREKEQRIRKQSAARLRAEESRRLLAREIRRAFIRGNWSASCLFGPYSLDVIRELQTDPDQFIAQCAGEFLTVISETQRRTPTVAAEQSASDGPGIAVEWRSTRPRSRFCAACGLQLPDEADFCWKCGRAVGVSETLQPGRLGATAGPSTGPDTRRTAATADELVWKRLLEVAPGLGSASAETRARTVQRLTVLAMHETERERLTPVVLDAVSRLPRETDQLDTLRGFRANGWTSLEIWVARLRPLLPSGSRELALADRFLRAQGVAAKGSVENDTTKDGTVEDEILSLTSDLASPSPEVWYAAAIELGRRKWSPHGDPYERRFWASHMNWPECLRVESSVAYSLRQLLEAGLVPMTRAAYAIVKASGFSTETISGRPFEPAPFDEQKLLLDALPKTTSVKQLKATCEVVEFVGWRLPEDKGGSAYSLGKVLDALSRSETIPHWKYLGEALDCLGWTPANDDLGARYWIGKLNWAEAERIGEPALPALRLALTNPLEKNRIDAHNTVVRLTGEGELQVPTIRERQQPSSEEGSGQKPYRYAEIVTWNFEDDWRYPH